jgi:hypothetical protein
MVTGTVCQDVPNGAVAARDRGVTAVPLLAADGDHAGAGQHADSPHVVMQMLATDADVAARPLASPDAAGEPAQPAKVMVKASQLTRADRCPEPSS